MIIYEKGSVMVRTAITSDIHRMSLCLRHADIQEVWASHNHTPRQALVFSFSVSPYCMTIVNKGVPTAMYGLSPDSSDTATVWLLGTTGIPAMYLHFLRLTTIMIPRMLDIFPRLHNYVDARNDVSIRWLSWAGATFGDPRPYGIEGQPFVPFMLTKSEVLTYV